MWEKHGEGMRKGNIQHRQFGQVKRGTDKQVSPEKKSQYKKVRVKTICDQRL